MSTADEAVVEALTAGGTAAERLHVALRTTADLLSLQQCHLYVREPASSSYRLVSGWGDSPPAPGASQPAGQAPLPDTTEFGGAASAAGQALVLELHGPRRQDLEPVMTPVGPLLPLNLVVPGQLEAVLLMQPRAGGFPWWARRRLERLRTPLRGVVAALHRETALERDLAAATARVETTRRLRDSALTPDRFLRLLLDLAIRATSSEGGFVAVSDRRGRLTLRVADGLPHRAEDLDVTPDTGVFDWSLADEGALLLRDPEGVSRLGIRSLLAVPLLGPGGPLGVVALSTHTRPASFDDHNLNLLDLLAEQVGLMIENERVFSDFTGRYLRVLQGIARTLDARRPESRGYHERVGQLSESLARALGLDGDEVVAVREAGLIHDVGLAAVPASDHVFLSDIEHPAVGSDLVDGLPLHPGIAAAVASHHEWYDGWGFPQGLRGQEIPVLGRVLGLAAFCVEMSTADAVRSAWSVDRVVEEVRQRAGTQFDPLLVEAAGQTLGGHLTGGTEMEDSR